MSAAEIEEVVGYLSHTNPLVKLEALKILTTTIVNQPSSLDIIDQMLNQTKTQANKQSLLTHLLLYVSDTVDLSNASLSLLILLSEHEALNQRMVETPIINICMERIRLLSQSNAQSNNQSNNEINRKNHTLLIKLIVNLTREEKGAESLMKPSNNQSINQSNDVPVHLVRLLDMFTQQPTQQPAKQLNTQSTAQSNSQSNSQSISATMYADPNEYIGHILLNVSQLQAFRKWLMAHHEQYFDKLSINMLINQSINQLINAPLHHMSNERLFSVLSLFRNLFFDPIEQAANQSILLSHISLVESIIWLILGSDFEIREEEREKVLPSVLDVLDAAKQSTEPIKFTPHPDSSIRRLAYEIITLCARVQSSRVYLKMIGIYQILREVHVRWEQTENGDKSLDEIIYEIVPYFILDEDGENNQANSQSNNQSNNQSTNQSSNQSSNQVEYLPEVAPAIPQARIQSSQSINQSNNQLIRSEEVEEEQDSEANDKIADLLDAFTLASDSVAPEIAAKRAEVEIRKQEEIVRKEASDKLKAEQEQRVVNQMLAKERVDSSVLEDEDDDEQYREASKQPINQSINQSINQPIRPVSQPIKPSPPAVEDDEDDDLPDLIDEEDAEAMNSMD